MILWEESLNVLFLATLKQLRRTVFDKLDANLAKAMMSIGAVKGFEMEMDLPWQDLADQ